jgi:hypothetical protein
MTPVRPPTTRGIGGVRGLFCAGLVALTACAPSPSPSSPTEPSHQAIATATAAATIATASQPAPSTWPVPAPFVRAPAWEPCEHPACRPIDVSSKATSATVTEHGVRLTLEVDAPTFSDTQEARVTTTIENLGSRTLRWSTYGCETTVRVVARTNSTWNPGAEHPRPFQGFKGYALEEFDPSTGPIQLRSSAHPFDELSGAACAEVVVQHRLAAGESVRSRARIVALASGPHGPAPAGPVLILAGIHDWYRGDVHFPFVDTPGIYVELPVELVGGRAPEMISGAQAIDVALGSEIVRDVVIRNPMFGQLDPVALALDAAAGEWRLTLSDSEHRDGIRRLTVIIDALDARVLEVQQAPES